MKKVLYFLKEKFNIIIVTVVIIVLCVLILNYKVDPTISGVLIGGLITLIASFVTNVYSVYQTEKTLKYQFNKEQLNKFEERIELIIDVLSRFNKDVFIIANNLQNSGHLIKDFESQTSKEKFKDLNDKGNNYMYMYFNGFYAKYGNLIELHKEILGRYLDLSSREWIEADRTFFFNKINLFAEKLLELFNILLKERDEYKKQLDL